MNDDDKQEAVDMLVSLADVTGAFRVSVTTAERWGRLARILLTDMGLCPDCGARIEGACNVPRCRSSRR